MTLYTHITCLTTYLMSLYPFYILALYRHYPSISLSSSLSTLCVWIFFWSSLPPTPLPARNTQNHTLPPMHM